MSGSSVGQICHISFHHPWYKQRAKDTPVISSRQGQFRKCLLTMDVPVEIRYFRRFAIVLMCLRRSQMTSRSVLLRHRGQIALSSELERVVGELPPLACSEQGILPLKTADHLIA